MNDKIIMAHYELVEIQKALCESIEYSDRAYTVEYHRHRVVFSTDDVCLFHFVRGLHYSL